MGNATPPVERLREEPHNGFRYKRSTLQALYHTRGRHTAHVQAPEAALSPERGRQSEPRERNAQEHCVKRADGGDLYQGERPVALSRSVEKLG